MPNKNDIIEEYEIINLEEIQSKEQEHSVVTSSPVSDAYDEAAIDIDPTDPKALEKFLKKSQVLQKIQEGIEAEIEEALNEISETPPNLSTIQAPRRVEVKPNAQSL